MNKTNHLLKAILTLEKELSAKNGLRWLVGGSCGLLLQGVPLVNLPRDLDVYVDADQVDAVYECLRPFAVDQPQLSTTGMYSSCLSHYDLDGVSLELVGSLKVNSAGSSYEVRIQDGLWPFRVETRIENKSIALMPLAHELIFNMLRHRPDRYIAIAGMISGHLRRQLPPLQYVLQHSEISELLFERLSRVLQHPPGLSVMRKE
ncbi:nucleotidyltransferase domain-containing protein [Paenibacillus sp. y28]|uniref:nucleotidyltransferase domain-containing protein n=1 Tax=Paenibacillus sp. y28 TaxID=3129110 RepID=UPI0030187BC4